MYLDGQRLNWPPSKLLAPIASMRATRFIVFTRPTWTQSPRARAIRTISRRLVADGTWPRSLQG